MTYISEIHERHARKGSSRLKFAFGRLNPPRDGVEVISPKKYDPSMAGQIFCAGNGCEAPLIFVNGYTTSGSSHTVPPSFRTQMRATHGERCNHADASQQKAGIKSFDPTIGLRFHLNEKVYKGWDVSEKEIQRFERDELLKIDPLYYRREIANPHGVADFADFFNTLPLERLQDSRLRYKNTLRPLSEFLISGTERMSALFNRLAASRYKQDGLPHLFYVKPEIWGRNPQENGTFALHCKSYNLQNSDGTPLTVQPRITFGEKGQSPTFDPKSVCRSDDPMLVLAVPKLFHAGNETSRHWIMYLDVVKAELIGHHTLTYAAARRPTQPMAPKLFEPAL